MKQEEKFLQLLYPTDNVRKVMINDVYQELLEIIPISLCYNSKNNNKTHRSENLKKALSYILNFIKIW